MTYSVRFIGLISGIVLFCLVLGGLPFGSQAADDLADSRDRLTRLQKKIEATLKDLQEKQGHAADLDDDLNQLSAEINRVKRQVSRSDRQLADTEQQLQEQRRQLAKLDDDQQQTTAQLKKRLTALYKSGDAGFFKILIASAETPRALVEKYEYLARMVRHDRQLIEAYRRQQQDKQAFLAKLETLREDQVRLAERRRKEQQLLEGAQVSKKRLLAAVRQDQEALANMLAELRAKAARLDGLVKKLESEQAQSYTQKLAGLAAHKGRLPWPVGGKVLVGYGTSRHPELGTLIESNGLEIAAPVGTPVAAVAAGKVIYASSLRGYGKLMILDHGNKDYSLYAHVARFNKQVGDEVVAQEKIAFSGFEGRESVYFEIRHGGQPLDPREWLVSR